ncbi:MAG: hypothetical protein JWO85_3012 [Candidatus Eremiobacteraeota bacterium]|jgi:hypothetical protein|nr:hypothetical protein [Candidatus Eremiobacteraeota bacterium]
MTHRRLRAFLAAGAVVASLVTGPCLANEPGYDVWFAGHVLSIDTHRGRMRVARGPTETSGRAVEECRVSGAALRLVRPGMMIEAQADTRRRPWRVLHLRVMERRAAPQGHEPTFAFVPTPFS